MKNNWKKYKLGDIAKIESGGTPSSKNSSYWDNGDIYWATLPDLSKKYITDTQRKITKLGLKKSSAKLLPVGTVIFSSRATIGQVSIAQVDISTNQGSKNFVCDSDQISNEFLYYLLISQTENIKKLAGGATYKEVNKTTLKNFEVEIPDIKLQKTIANILCNYDDLIENNTKRIQILEEMAKNLYEEWFVNFKFPGHEKIKMVDSDLGKIPEGWKVSKVKDFGNVITGKTPSKRNDNYYSSDDIPFIKTPDMHDSMFCLETSNYLSYSGASSQKNKNLPPNTICVSCIGTVGIVTITTKKISQTNQQINSLVLNNLIYREYIYLCMKSLKSTIERYGSNGATMTNLNKTKFESLKLLNPSINTIKEFNRLVSPFFDEIRILSKKNVILKKARDLLSPRLISGEIEV